eukprot:1891888-Lingulodinium_polyedra.AAC.1
MSSEESSPDPPDSSENIQTKQPSSVDTKPDPSSQRNSRNLSNPRGRGHATAGETPRPLLELLAAPNLTLGW